jgi:undecaprenyl-diphosphatase
VKRAAERVRTPTRAEASIAWWESLLIGCAQASALIPGMSRSGTTISMGMFLGIRRDAAARFTFLLAIPAMVAAAAKEALELREMPLPPGSLSLLAIGTVVSAVTGYLTITFFLRYLGTNRLDLFAAYRLVLAGATLLWLLTR